MKRLKTRARVQHTNSELLSIHSSRRDLTNLTIVEDGTLEDLKEFYNILKTLLELLISNTDSPFFPLVVMRLYNSP